MRLSLLKEALVVRVMYCLVLVALLSPYTSFSQYALFVKGVDRDAAYLAATFKIQENFRSRAACIEYVDKIPGMLRAKGYASASIDSARFDSLSGTVSVFLGEKYNWAHLDVSGIDRSILESIGWNERNFKSHPLDPGALRLMQNKILDYLENNGYPFALVRVDSISFDESGAIGKLTLDKGPLYKIDSIRNLGTARISTDFLQRYLNLPKGSVYRKDKLSKIDSKLGELPYVKQQNPWNITMLGTGSVLNLYLAPKKSSEINVLIGLLPSSEQLNSGKMLITGEANINLRNALGSGETIGLNWQQIQVQSPRLHLLFQQPYLFKSPFGLNFNFDLFKKDSSWVNIGMTIGAMYALSSSQSGSVFFQNLTTNLLTVDTFSVKATRKLPDEADVHSLNVGVNYQLYTTDYRFNPRRGDELSSSISAGIRNIKVNNVITKLQDNSDPSFNFGSLYDTVQLRSYQFRVRIQGAHYFPLTRYSTVKISLTGGWFESPGVFRNELFQIGGYKLLRGFDEESIYASAYGVSSAEYRYLIGANSYLFAFFDFGMTKNKISSQSSGSFMGTGLGMAFETKAGIFNISYAVGKRDDAKFNLRQSKIHIGYVNYF